MESVVATNTDRAFEAALAKQRDGDSDDAERAYRDIVASDPDHSGAWHYLAMILHDRGAAEEADRCFEKSLTLAPGNPVYRNNFGVACMERGSFKDAEILFKKAVALDPDYADAHSNLGGFQLTQGLLREAAVSLKRALEIKPGHADAQQHLLRLRLRQGHGFAEKERFQEASRAFQDAASLPGGREMWRWKSLGFCPTVFPDENTADRYWHQLENGLDLASRQDFKSDWRSLPFDGFTPSFNLPHLNRCCRSLKEKFAKIFEGRFPTDRPTLKETRQNRTRTRIGFVVTVGHHRGFLRVHRHLVKRLAPKKFEVFLFCPSGILEECRQAIGRDDISCVGLPGSFELAVEMLREGRCDILYHWKIGGGVLDYFLAMSGSAPIQCTSYGTHGTSGTKATDYYLSSAFRENEDSRSHYSERLVCLDAHVSAHPAREPGVGTRQDFGFPATGALYFCPHRPAKYHPVFDTYIRDVLERDGRGHLVLMTGKKPELAELLQRRLRHRLGESFSNRILTLPSISFERYRSLLSVMTCVLDSPVFAGDLTTHDAFECGVPVVSQTGPLPLQRTTACMYRLMGMDSMTPGDQDAYVDLAVRLGTESGFRETIRRTITERREAVFDVGRCVREYERFFETICE